MFKNFNKNKWLYLLIGIFGVVFIVCGAIFIPDQIQRYLAEKDYRGIQLSAAPEALPTPMVNTTAQTDPPAADSTASADLDTDEAEAPDLAADALGNSAPSYAGLAKLREQNEDIIAYIEIPGTRVSYPVLQGEDNEYYLHKLYNHKTNAAGSIFMDFENKPDFSDQNTVLYGHRRNNGSMFADLEKFRDQSFASAHAVLTLTLPDRAIHAQVVAVNVLDMDADYRAQQYAPRESFDQHVKDLLQNSLINMNFTPTYGQRLLTLSTCLPDREDSEKRLVVTCVLMDSDTQHLGPWQPQ